MQFYQVVIPTDYNPGQFIDGRQSGRHTNSIFNKNIAARGNSQVVPEWNALSIIP